MVQTTLDLFEASMMEEVKNFELGERPRILTRQRELFNLTQMVKGERQISILHKDLSVVKTEFFVSGRTKDKVDFTSLAFGLLGIDDIN